ncbi:MAG: HAD family hydrolase [Ignavibacteriaceae bacterium]|nr:HAD family hydrolase [Ignavibacteriaceae bacterium]
MKINHLCFDLDGTLVDSGQTIYKSTIGTLDRLNIKYSFTKADLDKRIGQHFVDIFNEFDVQVQDFEGFIKVYKSIYFDFIDDSVLYNGVFDFIKMIKEKNVIVSLLTTKAQDQADLIIEHFNLLPYFDYIMGRKNGIPHKPSPEPLLIICNKLNVLPEETLMIGDTELDIQCGKNAGTKTCGLTYGYRTRKQLEENKPDYIIDSITELHDLIYNEKSLK